MICVSNIVEIWWDVLLISTPHPPWPPCHISALLYFVSIVPLISSLPSLLGVNLKVFLYILFNFSHVCWAHRCPKEYFASPLKWNPMEKVTLKRAPCRACVLWTLWASPEGRQGGVYLPYASLHHPGNWCCWWWGLKDERWIKPWSRVQVKLNCDLSWAVPMAWIYSGYWYFRAARDLTLCFYSKQEPTCVFVRELFIEGLQVHCWLKYHSAFVDTQSNRRGRDR